MTSRKKKAPLADLEKSSAKFWNPQNLLPVVLVIVLAGIPFAVGKYIEFSTHDPFDSSLNIYSAQQIVNGGKLDVDVFPSARPATLLVNVIGVAIFGYSEFGPKFIQMLMQLIALGLMFYTCRKLYGPAAAIVAVTLAAFFLSAPPYAKFGNVKEQYMIACMVIAACTLLLRYADGGWWWLLVSGAAAINAYFFKQTGVSVIVAMAVFIILQPMLKQRSWKIMAQDIALLFAGAVIGLIPLMIFFAGHDQLFSFIARIPGLGFIKGRALAKVSSGYVEASREASDFDTQIQSVLGYYLSFVLPIGLALSALGWWIYQTGKKLKNRKSENESYYLAERAVILFAIWWILDMAFIWISPRSYVQYYLPLNASAAMLTAYIVSQFRAASITPLIVIIVWPATALILTLATSGSIPAGLWWQIIAMALAAALYFWLRKPSKASIRRGLLYFCCVFLALWWTGIIPLPGTGPVGEQFAARLDQIKAAQQAGGYPWEKIGEYIKTQSQPGDGLYVWGWYPGIYIAAKQTSPTFHPSYSNMHTDAPAVVEGKVKGLVEQLAANPPKFIVDAQKDHFPYATPFFPSHPRFDLWPRLFAGSPPQLDLKPGQPDFGKPIPADMLGQVNELMLNQVEQYTKMVLTHEKRPGGAVAADLVKELAQNERKRHEAMLPLRKFVVENYKPILIKDSPLLIFRYNGPQ